MWYDAQMCLAAGDKKSQRRAVMAQSSDITQVCATMLCHGLVLNWALQKQTRLGQMNSARSRCRANFLCHPRLSEVLTEDQLTPMRYSPFPSMPHRPTLSSRLCPHLRLLLHPRDSASITHPVRPCPVRATPIRIPLEVLPLHPPSRASPHPAHIPHSPHSISKQPWWKGLGRS